MLLLSLLLLAASPRPLLVTIDDLPVAGGLLHRTDAERAKVTTDLLAVLEKHKIKAIVFANPGGMMAPGDRTVLERWIDAGHELGNHGFKHLDYSRTDAAVYIADVERAREALQAIAGPKKQTIRFYRYPFDREGDTLAKVAAMKKYLADSKQRNVPVTIDDQDWSFAKPYFDAKRANDQRALELIVDDYLAHLRTAVRYHEAVGDRVHGKQTPQVILLHANEIGSFAWDRFFSWLTETGHRFATADEVLADPVFADLPDRPLGFGLSTWERRELDERDRKAREEIGAVFDAQNAAWNRGDRAGFCSAYAEDATLVSPSGVTRGCPEMMGTRTSKLVEVRLAAGFESTRAGDSAPSRVHGASALLEWKLVHPNKQTATGRSLIALERRWDGTWLIVQDASM